MEGVGLLPLWAVKLSVWLSSLHPMLESEPMGQAESGRDGHELEPLKVNKSCPVEASLCHGANYTHIRTCPRSQKQREIQRRMEQLKPTNASQQQESLHISNHTGLLPSLTPRGLPRVFLWTTEPGTQENEFWELKFGTRNSSYHQKVGELVKRLQVWSQNNLNLGKLPDLYRQLLIGWVTWNQ